MSGSFQALLAGVQPRVIVVATAGAGSVTTPVGYSKVTVEAIGGGGNGFGSNTQANRASGGGGRYARSNANIPVVGGSTIVYYSVGAAATQSWVNVGTNAAPTLASTGCLAPNGTSGTSGVAGSGSAGTAIGTVLNGGAGITGNNSQGGGGAGASTAAGTRPTAGTDTTRLSPTQLMGSGTGGAYNSGTGTAPGGAGGGSATTGTNLAGAIGRVRIVFYP